MAFKPNVNPHLQRYQELAAELLDRHKNEPAENPIQVQGDSYIVPISARHNESWITDAKGLYAKIRRAGGVEKVLELYSITLTNARKFLTKKEQAKFIAQERTGSREIGEPVLKQKASAAA